MKGMVNPYYWAAILSVIVSLLTLAQLMGYYNPVGAYVASFII